jgi:hypothetical protein
MAIKGAGKIGKAHAQGKSDALVLEGEKALMRALKYLDEKASKNIAYKGTRKQVQALAKQMKQDIPSRFKNARKGVGWRATKGRAASSRNNKRAAVAKAGVKVGIKKAKIKALGEQHNASRGGRPGVGIGAANFQWWIRRTRARRTHAGKYTGQMGGHLPGFAGKSAKRAAGKMHLAGLREYRKQLNAEAKKASK